MVAGCSSSAVWGELLLGALLDDGDAGGGPFGLGRQAAQQAGQVLGFDDGDTVGLESAVGRGEVGAVDGDDRVDGAAEVTSSGTCRSSLRSSPSTQAAGK